MYASQGRHRAGPTTAPEQISMALDTLGGYDGFTRPTRTVREEPDDAALTTLACHLQATMPFGWRKWHDLPG